MLIALDTFLVALYAIIGELTPNAGQLRLSQAFPLDGEEIEVESRLRLGGLRGALNERFQGTPLLA